MLSPRDWIERLRGAGARARSAPRPASLPDVFELPADVREVLLDLERRGQLRRALRMAPDRAVLAGHLAELVAEHGPDAFREALALLDLPAPMVTTRSLATPATPARPAPAPAPARSQPAAADADPLQPDVVAQLANLNVNQWRDGKTTDGWYAPGRDGQHELFVVRASVPPGLLRELSRRGALRREAHGVAAAETLTFTVQAGKFPFRGVLALDIEKLKSITGSSFEAIHARWDAADRKYPVTVTRGEEVKHEPVT